MHVRRCDVVQHGSQAEPCAANCTKPSQVAAAAWPSTDTYVADERADTRRAIRRIEQAMAERAEAITAARRRRTIARRLVVAMSVATVLTSAGILLLGLSPAAPVSAALWVVPSALGGSAVAQSAAALRASADIRAARRALVCLQLALDALQGRLRCLTQVAHAP